MTSPLPLSKSTETLHALTSFVHNVAAVPAADIAALAAQARTHTFKKHELFCRPGQTCQQLIFIHQGVFRYFVLHADGDYTKDFAVDTQNALCTSFTSLITQEPSQIGIEALEDSTVWIWQAKDVLPLFETHHTWTLFAKRLTESMYIRKERRELTLLTRSPQENYRQFLIDFPKLDQRIPQYMIASYLGITPESLSRIRRRLTHRP